MCQWYHWYDLMDHLDIDHWCGDRWPVTYVTDFVQLVHKQNKWTFLRSCYIVPLSKSLQFPHRLTTYVLSCPVTPNNLFFLDALLVVVTQAPTTSPVALYLLRLCSYLVITAWSPYIPFPHKYLYTFSYTDTSVLLPPNYHHWLGGVSTPIISHYIRLLT